MCFDININSIPVMTLCVCIQNTEPPSSAPLIMRDMPQMASFVFDFYKDKVQNLMRQQGVSSC